MGPPHYKICDLGCVIVVNLAPPIVCLNIFSLQWFSFVPFKKFVEYDKDRLKDNLGWCEPMMCT
jgi:hypothetical protein